MPDFAGDEDSDKDTIPTSPTAVAASQTSTGNLCTSAGVTAARPPCATAAQPNLGAGTTQFDQGRREDNRRPQKTTEDTEDHSPGVLRAGSSEAATNAIPACTDSTQPTAAQEAGFVRSERCHNQGVGACMCLHGAKVATSTPDALPSSQAMGVQSQGSGAPPRGHHRSMSPELAGRGPVVPCSHRTRSCSNGQTVVGADRVAEAPPVPCSHGSPGSPLLGEEKTGISAEGFAHAQIHNELHARLGESGALPAGKAHSVDTAQPALETEQAALAHSRCDACIHQVAAPTHCVPLAAAIGVKSCPPQVGGGKGVSLSKRAQDHREVVGSIHRDPTLASRGQKVPEHPCLRITNNSVQMLTSRYVRRLVVMKKYSEYDDSVVAAWKASLGPPAMAIDALHDAVYQSQAKSSERPRSKLRFRGKTQ